MHCCCLRRLFAAKGYRMVNPLLPRANDGTGPVGALPPLQTPVPRLSNDDKWLLYRRLRRWVGIGATKWVCCANRGAVSLTPTPCTLSGSEH